MQQLTIGIDVSQEGLDIQITHAREEWAMWSYRHFKNGLGSDFVLPEAKASTIARNPFNDTHQMR